MGNRPSRTHYHHRVVYTGETAAQKQERLRLAEEKKRLEELVKKRLDPELFNLNELQGFLTFLSEIPNLRLPSIIQKNPHENHVGVFGLTAVGKSTLLNALAKKKVVKVGMGKITRKRELIFVKENVHYWDVPGHIPDEYDYFKIENLGFLADLDTIIFLFDKSPKDIERFARTADKIREGKKPAIYCRTKCDNGETNNDAYKWIKSDAEYLSGVIGKPVHVHAISGRNVWSNFRECNDAEFKFDFDKMVLEIMK